MYLVNKFEGGHSQYWQDSSMLSSRTWIPPNLPSYPELVGFQSRPQGMIAQRWWPHSLISMCKAESKGSDIRTMGMSTPSCHTESQESPSPVTSSCSHDEN